jgi:hypothetical protein
MRVLASSNEVTKQRKADAGLRRSGNLDDACSGTTRDRGVTDSLSGRLGQTVRDATKSNLKLLKLLYARDGTSVANAISTSVVERLKVMVRDSLSPVRSNGLVERDFGHPFLSLHREMVRLFDMFHDRLGGPMPAGSQHGPMMPSIDVSETDQEMRISADLPGVSEGDMMSPSLTTYLPFAARRSSTRRTIRRTTTFGIAPTARSCVLCDCHIRSIPIKSGQTLPMARSR